MRSLKQIVCIYLIVFCYSCSSDNTTLFLEDNLTESTIPNKEKYLIFNFKNIPHASNTREIRSGEYNICRSIIQYVFSSGSIYELILQNHNWITAFIGIDESLGNAETAYYYTYTTTIYFSPNIRSMNTESLSHEFLHLIQHMGLGYTMQANDGIKI